MPNYLSAAFEQWRSHPRRYDLPFLAVAFVRRYLARGSAERRRHRLLVPPIDTLYVEVLNDPAFRASCASVRQHTLLDVARLANLWCLAQFVGDGIFIEVGSYKGGGALHICNAVRGRRKFYCFDPFEDAGFASIQAQDELFHKDQFRDTHYDSVVELLRVHNNAEAIKGFFPSTAYHLSLNQIAFCHLDVDVYQATKDSLDFIKDRLAPKSLIVLDDLNRGVKGVQQAVLEFLNDNPGFMLLPMFPSQGILLSKALW
jgi:O-methyltransferase